MVKLHHHFYIVFGNTNLISGRFCHLGCPQSLGFSLQLLNPYCSFADTSVFMLYIWIISLFWLAQGMPAREHEPYFTLFWFALDYTLFLPSQIFVIISIFLFMVSVWIQGTCLYLYHLTNFRDTAVGSFIATDSPAHLFYSFHYYLPEEHQVWRLYELQQSQVTYQFPEMRLSLQLLQPITGLFYIQGYGFPLFSSGSSSDLMPKVYVALC